MCNDSPITKAACIHLRNLYLLLDVYRVGPVPVVAAGGGGDGVGGVAGHAAHGGDRELARVPDRLYRGVVAVGKLKWKGEV